MEEITVNVSSDYKILVDEGLLEKLPSIITPFSKTKKVMIITDSTVFDLYAKNIENNLKVCGYSVFTFVFPSGESSKNMSTLSDILEFAAENKLTRQDLFIAIGGGVVGDIAGLAAALYMRGLPVIQVPTTLLSAVDSSIGGKTAVDLKNGKNLVGVFKQPCLVVIDTAVINNLPDDIFCEGLGEVIKCNVIKDISILGYILEHKEKENIKTLISRCLTLKRDVVEQDEFDRLGIRNLLNVGHTIAHAIELLSNYQIPHGRAVAMGLVIESRISYKLGLCDSTVPETIEKVIRDCGLYFDLDYKGEEFAKACLSDKKNKGSKIVFMLPKSIGDCTEVGLTLSELTSLL